MIYEQIENRQIKNFSDEVIIVLVLLFCTFKHFFKSN